MTLPPAGAHGGDGPAVAAALGLDPADLLDLSQNMNPVAPPVAALVRRHLDTLGRYPDARPATTLLAQALGVDPARVLLTNGGSEAIHLVTAVLGGHVRSEPEFGLHPRGSGAHGGGSESGEGGNGEGGSPEQDDVVWRSDPHSPSGRLAGADDRADVWDEAFYALATGRWTAGREGVTVVGSLTKTFACPGLRLGYVVGDPDVVRRCAERQPHWPVSTLALAVLPELLDGADLPGWASRVTDLRRDLVALLRSHGLAVDAADAPWVLVDGPGLRARLAPHGVLVRDCTSFGMPGVARVAVPDEPGLERLERALARSA